MTKQIKKELQNSQAIELCAKQCGLVGDPTRMKICWLLCHHPELSVGEIAKMLSVSDSVVSHSLKKLKINKLVKTRNDHKKIYYHISDPSFKKFLQRSFNTLI